MSDTICLSSLFLSELDFVQSWPAVLQWSTRALFVAIASPLPGLAPLLTSLCLCSSALSPMSPLLRAIASES